MLGQVVVALLIASAGAVPALPSHVPALAAEQVSAAQDPVAQQDAAEQQGSAAQQVPPAQQPPAAQPASAAPATTAQSFPAAAPSSPAAAPSSPAAAPSSPAAAQSFPAAAAARGTLGSSVSIPSAHLGYAVNIRVYEPPSAATCESLPVLYVTDGSDYWKPELGNVVDTLDALITSGRLAPILAVFIDAWDPVQHRNRRYEQFLPAGTETLEPFESCPFCDFIVEEVVPWVEARYPVDTERRGILGSSLGGFNAAYMALTHPDLFHVVGIQSPSIWRQPWFAERVARATVLPQKVAIDVGVDESKFLPGARALRDAYSSRGVPLQYREAAFDHSWRHWRATTGEVLMFLYPLR